MSFKISIKSYYLVVLAFLALAVVFALYFNRRIREKEAPKMESTFKAEPAAKENGAYYDIFFNKD